MRRPTAAVCATYAQPISLFSLFFCKAETREVHVTKQAILEERGWRLWDHALNEFLKAEAATGSKNTSDLANIYLVLKVEMISTLPRQLFLLMLLV